MNKIYIINNTISSVIELNFKENNFKYDNKEYKFNLINYDKLLVFWNNLKTQIFYTEDSYLYYSDFKFKNIYKKIFLIHNEWNDQAILNYEKMTLERINHNEQIGKFIIDNNNLIIEWKDWGKEIYIKKDNYTYVQSNYNFYESNSIIKTETDTHIHIDVLIPIHIFIHVCMIENWKDILNNQIENIKKSGLYDIAHKIHLGILGDIENEFFNEIFKDDKFDILYIDKRVELYEIHTINYIKYFCDNISSEIYILYIHTKGVRNAGNKETIKSWRLMMEYFLVNKYKECINYLSIFDTLGSNIVNSFCCNKEFSRINENHTFHYSGNFWWSKKSYIDKLNYINLDLTKNSINTRYKAENWILSNYPDANIGILFQDDTNTHPYHRYIFDYYKDLNNVIKKL